jgi:outer membrane protein assembly factor BamB
VDDTLRTLERTALGAPGDADAQFRLGAALIRAGRSSEAATALRAALVAQPAHALAQQEIARIPGLARGPWPSEDGDEDGARRSAFPGARRGTVSRSVVLPAAPRGAPVITADGRALVATLEGAYEIDPPGRVALRGPPIPQRGPPVVAGSGRLVLLLGERGVGVLAAGVLAWEIHDLGGRAFEPIVADELVILGVEDVGLLALDVATGHERWRVAMDAESYSRPSLGELVYTAVRGGRPSVVRGYGEAWRWQLHAIERTGHVRWSSEPRAERDTGTPQVPLVQGASVFARVEAEVLALDARDGKLLAEAKANGPIALGADGLVRVLQGERLLGLDARGVSRWQGDGTRSYMNGRLAVDGEGTTYVATNERVVAIGKSGGYLWSCAVPRITSRPAIGNGCVLVTSFHERTVNWIE